MNWMTLMVVVGIPMLIGFGILYIKIRTLDRKLSQIDMAKISRKLDYLQIELGAVKSDLEKFLGKG